MLMLNFLLKNVHHGLMVSMIALLITAFNHSFWVVFKAPEGGFDVSPTNHQHPNFQQPFIWQIFCSASILRFTLGSAQNVALAGAPTKMPVTG